MIASQMRMFHPLRSMS